MRAAGSDRITDIAVVVVQGARRELVFESLVNPGFPIPTWITGITGITDTMVRNAPPFEEIAEQLLAALAGRVFVAHNARFDWRFVAAEVRRSSDLALDGPHICTVRLARRLLPHLESRSLDSLTYYFGLDQSARATVRRAMRWPPRSCSSRLLEMARDAGARTLSDLEAMTSGKGVPGSESAVGQRGPTLPPDTRYSVLQPVLVSYSMNTGLRPLQSRNASAAIYSRAAASGWMAVPCSASSPSRSGPGRSAR